MNNGTFRINNETDNEYFIKLNIETEMKTEMNISSKRHIILSFIIQCILFQLNRDHTKKKDYKTNKDKWKKNW